VKQLAFDRAVNTSIGLPFIRTSPDHGTAFDIAGLGIADATSMKAALAQLAYRRAGLPVLFLNLPFYLGRRSSIPDESQFLCVTVLSLICIEDCILLMVHVHPQLPYIS
jgi:hypothetical protein